MASTPDNEDRHGLHTGLKRRHVTMIALGGVIGAGLFVGSGAVINQTGPAAVLSYLMAGVLVVLVMRMLDEMAVANPSTGSFSDYARLSLGNWAGFSVGWLYWWFWVIVLAVEAVAGAEILQRWIDVPIWASSLVLMILLTLTNLVSEGVRRVRVLVRIDQGRRDRRVHLPRAGVRLRPHGRRGRRVPAHRRGRVRARGLRDGAHGRGDRDLCVRRGGDRDDRGGGVRRAPASRHQGDQLGDRAGARLPTCRPSF